VAEHQRELTLVDVREPKELDGELGAIEGTVHLPLGELRARLAEVPKDKPVIAICRSGKRSAQACSILEKGGFTSVANLAGGMIRWRALGLRVANAS
jgi:sulfur dioxygenase